MKLKRAFFLSILSLASLGMVACNRTPVESSSSSDLSSSDLSSSGEELPEWVDYAASGAIKLELDYEGHTFSKDGIEQVTLKTAIDGDTAHFTPKTPGQTIGDGDYIKSRFYGIDTPESTGNIQDYGFGASDYTKAVLKEASAKGTIVVSTPGHSYQAPKPDSTSVRYVSLIWVNTEKKNAPKDELKLLNLMIVQDGWSWVKNLSDVPEYVETFQAAENQAKLYKLNLFSGLPDPRVDHGGFSDVSLVELKRAIQNTMKDPDYENPYNNKNVRVFGTVAGFSNHVLYLQDYCYEYNEDGSKKTDENGNPIGEYGGINIFCGMSAIPSKFTKVGTYISVCGTALDSENFGFQISNAKFPVGVSYSDSDAKVILKADENTEEHALHTFEYTASEFNTVVTSTSYNYESLNCNVKITEPLTVTGGYTSSDHEMTLYISEKGVYNFNIYVTMAVKPDPNNTAIIWDNHEKFIGHKISVGGVFGFHKTTSGKYNAQIMPSSNSDLVVLDYTSAE